MLIKHKVPKTIQWIIKLFIIYLFIFTSFRIATLVFFKPAGIGFGSIISSFFLGLKYDLRWIAIFLLPIACISLFPRFSPFYSDKAKKSWTIYLAIITLLVLFFFGVDFGHFAYVSTRLNANALNYTQDAKITAAVLWQSYPIIWILSGVVGALLMIAWIFKRLHVTVEEQNINIHKFSFRKRWHIITILVLGWFVYGFLTLTPLQWSSAFKLKSNFNSYLALNPFQNFISTLRFRKPAVEEDKARLYYSVIKKFLQLENTNHTNRNYQRIIYPGSNHIESRPNIVMVICENFSMYKSSMSGNSLNSTPYFNELRKQGIFFENCFSPTFGTARSVFSLLTGIPDVQLSKFSSRTEDSKNQVTVINNFEGYKKMYFIGGSSEFNNYKGILSNIKDINIYDEGDFTSPKLNVWGISDKNLFLEANKKMKEVGQPFFSIIQTSDNRRPFTIPTEDSDFVQRNITNPELKKYGFESLKEFNSFSYTDYCYKIFIETAKQSPYFENTIFCFYWRSWC
jgi:phosphoglycerol transferase MdoB-like AlkP superfamily enzyme